MAKYTRNYMLSHDIDWFCSINGWDVHLASAGSYIPQFANDLSTNRKNQRQAYTSEHLFEKDQIIVNEPYVKKRLESSTDDKLYSHKREMYIRSFVDMAQRGYISMDHNNFDIDSTDYVVIAYPPEFSSKKIENPSTMIDLFNIDNFVGIKKFSIQYT